MAAYEDVQRNTDDADRDVLPASERLKAGGADTVRGFRERSLGPIARYPDTNDNGTPTGATRFSSSTAVTMAMWTRFSCVPVPV